MELLTYLLKVTTCTVLFFGFYLLVLRKLTFFKINRFYLLVTLLLSFVIPALQISIERIEEDIEEPVIEQSIQVIEQQQIQALPEPVIEEKTDWISLIPYVYYAIVFVLLSLCAWRLFQLIRHTKNHNRTLNGLKLVPKAIGFTNCSFFNYVFINNDNLTESELQVLLRHEQVHANQFHSVDKLLMMVFKAVLWINPIVYLYDKALEQVHEYEADEITSKDFGNEVYANLMLKLAVSNKEIPLVHSFVKSPIKERIKMLFNSKSKKMKKLMYLLALPLGLILIWSFTINITTILPEKLDQKFTLVIDAGHGGTDKGAVVDDYYEKDLTLKIAQEIKQIAEKKGLNVILTRSEDVKMSLKDRSEIKGDFFISLHFNKEEEKNTGTKNGIEILYPIVDNGDGLRVEKSAKMFLPIFNGLKALDGINCDNQPHENGSYVLKNNINPSILLELGYLTNEKDLAYITNDIKQKELSDAIVNGVLSYVKNSKSDKEINKSQNLSDSLRKGYNYPGKSNKQYPVLKAFVNSVEPNDTTALIKADRPKLLSSKSVTVDTKSGISYIEDAIIECRSGLLKAKNAIWDNKNNAITATNGSLKTKDYTVFSEKIILDLKNQTFQIEDPRSELKKTINTNPDKVKDAINPNSKVSYKASDSVKMNKDRTVVDMYGKAELLYNDIKLTGSKITFNVKDLTAAIKDARLFSGYNNRIKADSIFMNLQTRKIKTFGKLAEL